MERGSYGQMSDLDCVALTPILQGHGEQHPQLLDSG